MAHLSRSLLATTAALAAGAALALGAAGSSVTSVGASHTAQPSAKFITEARQALVGYLRHDHPGVMLTGAGHPVSNGVTAEGSYNWSGYADTSTTTQFFTSVSGSWTTPSVSCTAEDQLTSDWVGLDGLTDGTVEQDGTIGWCFEGTPVYFTWYEMYPAGTVEVGTSLQPGDQSTASVTQSAGNYTLKLTDSTHSANSFTRTAKCATGTCLDESAEWISERPAFSVGITPQAHYNAFTLSSGAQKHGTSTGKITYTGSTTYELTMIDATQSYNLNTVTTLTTGNKFSTTWQNSY